MEIVFTENLRYSMMINKPMLWGSEPSSGKLRLSRFLRAHHTELIRHPLSTFGILRIWRVRVRVSSFCTSSNLALTWIRSGPTFHRIEPVTWSTGRCYASLFKIQNGYTHLCPVAVIWGDPKNLLASSNSTKFWPHHSCPEETPSSSLLKHYMASSSTI